MTFRFFALSLIVSFLFSFSNNIIAQDAKISGVNFYYPSNAYRPIVTEDIKAYIVDLKSYVDNNADAIIKLDGYAQDGKNEEWNTRVSKYRVRELRDILVDHGIRKSRIEIAYFGKTNFIAEDDSTKEKAKNRRVELRIENSNS